MKTIYLAGSVNGKKWDVVPKHPYVEYVSSDGWKHSEHKWSNGNKEFGDPQLQAELNERFIAKIKSCDAMFAYLDTPFSYGSIAEIAYASAINVPVWMVINTRYDREKERATSEDNEWTWEDTWKVGSMNDAYWFVSNFPGVHAVEKLWDHNNVGGAGFVFQRFLGFVLAESEVEIRLWNEILGNMQLRLELGYELPTPQYPLNGYRLDFALPDHKLAVEVDGHDYHKTKEQRSSDAKRDRSLLKQGWTTLRFTGSDVYRNAEGVVNEIADILKNMKTQPEAA